MVKNAAVVAHFDPNNLLEDNFRLMLSCLEQVFDVVVLITTSDLSEQVIAQLPNIVTIKRPNIGYDFYSYRVGLSYIYQHLEVANVLLVNSSFVVTDVEIFNETLISLLTQGKKYDAVGITESRQFNQHLQSYLLLLSYNVLQSTWFKIFVAKVQPFNSKLEIILSCEIGLSRLLHANGAKELALFRPNWKQKFLGEFQWMCKIANTHGWLLLKPLRHRREINWTHFGAAAIDNQFGFIKTELLRTNPHSIFTNFSSRFSNPATWVGIKTLLDHSRSRYKVEQNGLTTFTSNHSSISASHAIKYGEPRAKGVRIAVVVHLYYYDLLDEICGHLNSIIEPYDLYVTTPFEGDIHKIINRTHTLANSVNIFLTENKGRDIGPFISLYCSGLLDDYFAVLKLHSKKSKYSSLGTSWRKQLFGKVVGDSLMIRRTLQLFQNNSVGLVGPHEFYLSHSSFWGANYESVRKLLTLCGEEHHAQEPELGFFAGSMFWFAPKSLVPLKNIPTQYFKFEIENGKQDGTLAHSMERIFCSIVKIAGYKVTSVLLSGKDISEIDTQSNRIPVL